MDYEKTIKTVIYVPELETEFKYWMAKDSRNLGKTKDFFYFFELSSFIALVHFYAPYYPCILPYCCEIH